MSGYELGSGNVFADLGLSEPEEELARAALAHRIVTIVEDRGLTPDQAAAIMRTDQQLVSALAYGHLESFSLERLARYLVALGQDVEIVVRPAHVGAHMYVRTAS